jgi:hypothetical protein
LALTEDGQALVEERLRQRRDRLELALAKMPSETREKLVQGLRALFDAVGCAQGRERSCSSGRSLLDWVREELEAGAADEERPVRAQAG